MAELRTRTPGLDEHAQKELDVIQRNGLRLAKLVNTLLDFSRIEANRVQAHYEPVNVAEVTAELASVFRSAIDRAGLQLIVDCQPLDEPVYLDHDMWEKVVLNLLSNALKYTFDGTITVRVFRDGDDAVVSVADTGIGVPAAEMPRLFERFHRIENARARSTEGSGIGLALVKELVGLHGGTIAAESVAGAGTTFTVRLPIGRRPSARRRTHLAGGRPRVLRYRRTLCAGSSALAARQRCRRHVGGAGPTVGARLAAPRIGRRRQRRHARIPGPAASRRRLPGRRGRPTASRRWPGSGPSCPTSWSAT